MATTGPTTAVRRHGGDTDLHGTRAGAVPRWHELMRLTADWGGARMSVFLPLRWGRPHHSKTRIRAKNLLRRAARELRVGGIRAAEADQLVASAQRVIDEALAFRSSAAGLALFVGPDGVRHFQVPGRLPELAVLGERFVIGPLLAQHATDGTFFVLTLNQEDIRLFEGTGHHMEEVDLDGHALAAWSTLPQPRPAQVHSFVADRGGVGGRAVFHGVGGGSSNDRKRSLARHFRGVDQALSEVLRDTRAPLVVAAVRNLQALYGEASSYPHLLTEGIDGSPRDLSVEQLHRRAWPIVEPALRREEDVAVDSYRQVRGTARAATDPEEVLAAATHGQVQTLLLHADAGAWRAATDDPSVLRLTDSVHPLEQLERAALETKRNGGAVFVLPAGRMPTNGPAGAVLRFAGTPGTGA